MSRPSLHISAYETTPIGPSRCASVTDALVGAFGANRYFGYFYFFFFYAFTAAGGTSM